MAAGTGALADTEDREDAEDEEDNMAQGFIPPHGGYASLRSFQMAQIVYDATVALSTKPATFLTSNSINSSVSSWPKGALPNDSTGFEPKPGANPKIVLIQSNPIKGRKGSLRERERRTN